MDKRMHKYIPWTDIVFYGGVSLGATICLIWALCTDQFWGAGAIVSLSVTVAAFWFVAAMVVFGKLFSRPDYFTKHDTAVWQAEVTDGKIPSLKLMNHAFDYFIIQLPKRWPDQRINQDVLFNLVSKTCVEWRSMPINLFSRFGWVIKDAAGAQSGHRILVCWLGSIAQTAFFHEMGHMVRQLILDKQPDYDHSDSEWWEMIRQLNRDFKYIV